MVSRQDRELAIRDVSTVRYEIVVPDRLVKVWIVVVELWEYDTVG